MTGSCEISQKILFFLMISTNGLNNREILESFPKSSQKLNIIIQDLSVLNYCSRAKEKLRLNG
jgi:hypothetical protein